jgi:transposase
MKNRKMINYIEKGKDIYIGLEDSKKSWKISVRCGGREIHYDTIEAKYSNLRSYLVNKYPECRIRVIYEAGFKGFGLFDKLVADGYECVVTPPNKVTQEKHSRVKTDKIDARRLAVVLENGDYKSCAVPDTERREDRQLNRTMLQVQTEISRVKNQIRRFFEFHGYAQDFPAGKWTDTHYAQARLLDLPAGLKEALDIYFRVLDMFKELRGDLMKKVLLLGKKDRYKECVRILRSVSGIGPLSAIRLVLEWGEDMGERFHTGAALACFSGLTQSEYSTGETTHKGRITGQGRGYIRGWLIQCAWVCIKKDPAMLRAFDRISRNTGNKKKAIVAIARKLVVRIWTCVHTKQEYCIGVVE